MIDFTAAPDARCEQASGARRRLFHIAVLSACGLFIELVLIRWLDAQVRPLAYVKNLPLIASFLGLGIGYATAFRRRPLVPYVALLLASLVVVAVTFSATGGEKLQSGPGGPESNLGTLVAESSVDVTKFYGIVAAIFALTVVSMVPIGQLAAEYMHGVETLRAYSANLIGSLAGVVAMFAFSAFAIPPWASASIALFVLCLYLQRSPLWMAISIVVVLLAGAMMFNVDHRPGEKTIWSPYNKIVLTPLHHFRTPDGREYVPGYQLSVQHLYYQRILDLSDRAVQSFPEFRGIRSMQQAYAYPYFWKKPHDILILGAGTGNDVAAALRNGADHVDAVDIDRRILDLGREYHPEHPYDSPKVTRIVDDARAYLGRTSKRYDMIVFGILDAHTSFYSSLAGGIRLDNYVYTTDSFRQALSRLTPDGILVISFYYEQPWLVTRLGSMLEKAGGGRKPYMLGLRPALYSFVTGPGLPPAPRFGASAGVPAELLRVAPSLHDATDDWPFLYLRDRIVPPTILRAAAGVLLISIVLVLIFFRGAFTFDRHFFFLGAGFLLIETRTIAQLALLFGTTWRVSAIAIAAILSVAIVANVFVERLGALPRLPLYVMLVIALIINFFVPLSAVVGAGVAARIGMTLLLALPVAFSSLIFASSAAKQRELSPVLASNLAGAVLGGLLENLSLLVGISALSLAAVVVYLLSVKRAEVS